MHMVGWLIFWAFVCIKVAGSSLAAWSWWWLLLPVVPVGSLVVKAWGL
jgi:hypothetical protein